MLLEGIFVPLTTPFHADGRLFVSKLQYNVERYSRTPANGMLVLGDLGEADGLQDEELHTVLSTAIQTAAPEKVLVAAVGRESVFATLAIAQFAARLGYDAVAVRGPLFAADASMQRETETYFEAVADGAGVPVLLLSEPGRCLIVNVIARLAQHPNVIGLIDHGKVRIAELKAATTEVSREVTVTTVFAAATGRMLKNSLAASKANLGGVALLEAHPGVKTRRKRVGFQMMTMAGGEMLESWQAGGAGSFPRLAACSPQACCEVWQAYKDGDLPLAEEKQERIREVAKRVEGHGGIAAVKHGADFNGYFGGRPRLPLLRLTAAEASQVEQELLGMRN